MSFEWHEEKREINLQRHGIDFIDAKEIWAGPVLEAASPQKQHGEDRFLAIGKVQGICITVVFTWRGNIRRLISARKARRYERENYEQATE